MAKVYDLLVRARGDSRDAQRAMKELRGSLSRTGDRMKSIGANMTRVITLPILGAAGASLKLASDAEETANKIAIVFGSELPGVIKKLDQFARSTGASRYELQEQVGVMGALMKSAGLTSGELASMSVDVVKLATDMASFNNVSSDEALKALRSGLSGEIEPLRKFGVFVSAAGVKQEAYRLGIAKTGQELTDGQKIQARYSLILKQTKDAQGDAARTSKSAANQAKRLKNSLKDLGTDIGKALLPFAQKLVEKVQGLTDWFRKLSPHGKKLALAIAGIAAVAGPLIFIVGGLVGGISALLPVIGALLGPAGLVIAAIVGLGVALVMAYRRSAEFRAAVKSAMDAAKQAITTLVSEGKATLESLAAFWAKHGETIVKVVMAAYKPLAKLIGGWLKGAVQVIRAIMAALRGDWGKAWGLLKSAVKSYIGGIVGYIRSSVGAFLSAGRAIGRAALNGLKDAWSGLRGWVAQKVSSAIDGIGGLKDKAQRVGSELGDAIKNAIRDAVNWVIDKWNNLELPSIKVAGKTLSPSVGTPNLPRFAKGGLVYGPTVGLMGEYPGARRNPEVVAPLDKLRDVLGGSGQTIVIQNMTVVANNRDEFVRSLDAKQRAYSPRRRVGMR